MEQRRLEINSKKMQSSVPKMNASRQTEIQETSLPEILHNQNPSPTALDLDIERLELSEEESSCEDVPYMNLVLA